MSRRALVLGIGAVVLLILLIWIAGANFVLRTEKGKELIGSVTGRTKIEWSGGWTLVPGVLHLDTLEIHGPGRRRDWRLQLGDVTARLSLFDLAARRIRVRWGDVGSLHFALEPHELRPPRKRKRQGPGKWSLIVDRARVHDLRGFEMGDFRLESEGRASTGMRMRFGGDMEFPRLDAVLENATIEGGEALLAELDRVAVKGRMGPFPTRQAKFAQFFETVSATVEVVARGAGPEPINAYFGGIPWLDLSGSGGTLESRLVLVQGVLQPGSSFDYRGSRLTARVTDYEIQGRPTLVGAVAEDAEPVVTLTFADYDLRRQGDESPYLEGDGLELEARAASASLFDPGDFDVVLDLKNGRVPDFAAYARALPKSSQIQVRKGSGTVDAHLELSTAGRAGGASRFQMVGEGVEVDYADLSLAGHLDLASEFVSVEPETMRFEVQSIELSLEEVTLRDTEKEVVSEWRGALRFEDGEMALRTPIETKTDLEVELTDARPLFAFLAEVKKSVRMVERLLKLRDLQGRAHLEMAQGRMLLDDLSLTSSDLDLEGELCLGSGYRSAAIHLMAWKTMGLAVGASDGRSNWSLVHPRKKYEEYRETFSCPEDLATRTDAEDSSEPTAAAR